MEAEQQWFAQYPELQDLCRFGCSYKEELTDARKYSYTPIPSYIQEGPQCGLVALAMIMQNATKDCVEDLFNSAKARNFTYNGEMLSVDYMIELATAKLKNYTIRVHEGHLHNSFICDFLLDSGLMLVPYPY